MMRGWRGRLIFLALVGVLSLAAWASRLGLERLSAGPSRELVRGVFLATGGPPLLLLNTPLVRAPLSALGVKAIPKREQGHSQD